MTRRAAFGLGANLGAADAALADAVRQLEASPLLVQVRASPIYRTVPVGGPAGQPDYCNAVVVADTDAPPAELLALAHRIEAAHGRTREVRWGPRTLDVDVLAVAGTISDDPVLTLPHPRAAERAFVLVPWAQVDPGFVVPGTGATVESLLAALPSEAVAQVRPLEAP
jgi:2-amino-4-hydroxy-6-hydroxymethyldihydropteridine diphosphokinase